MSTTISIPDEIYTRLQQPATARGVTIPQVIARLLEDEEKTRSTSSSAFGPRAVCDAIQLAGALTVGAELRLNGTQLMAFASADLN
jgi:predicted DNA-binding ribbon-helix-helix protein